MRKKHKAILIAAAAAAVAAALGIEEHQGTLAALLADLL